MMLHINIKALALVVSEKIFSCFPIQTYVKHVTPGARDATYQISRLKALWFLTERFFHVFPI